MSDVTRQDLADLERARLRALVAADEAALAARHAPDFMLIHPGGGAWSKAEYVGGVVAGTIDYRRFDPVSDIEVVIEGGLAVLRYRSVIDIHVRGQAAGLLRCWHTDCYRATPGGDDWCVFWSQATEISGRTEAG